jgi:hypothetical protein
MTDFTDKLDAYADDLFHGCHSHAEVTRAAVVAFHEAACVNEYTRGVLDWAALTLERDALRARAEAAERERDAAHQHLHAWKVQYDKQAAELARVSEVRRWECNCIQFGPEPEDDMAVRAKDYDELQADNARLRKDYEEGIEAWRQNNAFFGEWIGKIAATLDIVLDDLMYKDHQRVIDFAREVLAEYKAARGAKLITPRSTTY